VFWAAAPLVPWFAWALLPLVLSNVLIANLLARDRFKVVPWVVAIAGAYALTLVMLKDRLLAMPEAQAFKTVVGTLGGYGLLLMLTAAWFHRGRNSSKDAAEAP
jgi:hypothetical protein